MDTRGAKSLLEDVGLYLEGQEDKIAELETKIDLLEKENLHQKEEIKFMQTQIQDLEGQLENVVQRGE